VIVHFEINFWYVLAFLKGIRDVFVSTLFSILIFLGQTVHASHTSHFSRVYVTHCLHRDFNSFTFHCKDLNTFTYIKIVFVTLRFPVGLRPSIYTYIYESCLIWTSLCMFFEVVTIDLHYMTDRQRFELKTSKLKLMWKQRHLHLGCP